MGNNIVFLSIAGLIGGFVGAQVGGGAMITLPALLLLRLPPALAIGTNVLSAWLINVAAVARYWKGEKLNVRISFPLALVATVGSVIGANLVVDIDSKLLSKITAVLFLILVLTIFIKPKTGLQKQEARVSHFSLATGSLMAFLFGIYGGFFSVSVATLFIFLFVLMFRQDLMHAVANSVFMTAIFLVGAVVVFIKEGNIDYSLGVPLAVTSVIGSYIGAHTALKLGDRWLKGMLTAVVAALVIKLLVIY